MDVQRGQFYEGLVHLHQVKKVSVKEEVNRVRLSCPVTEDLASLDLSQIRAELPLQSLG